MLNTAAGGGVAKPAKKAKPLSPEVSTAVRKTISGITNPAPSRGVAPVGHSTVQDPIDYRPSVTPTRKLIRPTPQVRLQPSAHSFLSGLRSIISPIEGMNPAEYTSSYGPRIHPITGRSSFHTGLDISSPQGTPVVAPANAVLARMVSGDSIYGNELVLAHNRTLDTMYGHMSAFAKGLQPGMKIRAGQVIGYVGSTGLSTGPHLHWETWNNGQPVNPVTFVGGS